MTAKKELFNYLQQHVVHIKDDESTITVARTIDLSDKICAALEEENIKGIRFMCEEATKLSDSDLNDSGLMHVPLDMNGEQVHLGDKVHDCEDGYDFTVDGFVIWGDSMRWWVYQDESVQYPLDRCTLIKQPSVKDLLYEMYDRLDEPSGDDQNKHAEEIIAEYVDRLQLREE